MPQPPDPHLPDRDSTEHMGTFATLLDLLDLLDPSHLLLPSLALLDDAPRDIFVPLWDKLRGCFGFDSMMKWFVSM